VSVGTKIVKFGDVCSLDRIHNKGATLPYVGLEDIVSGEGRFTGSTEPKRVQSSTFKFTSEHILYGRLRPYLNKVYLPAFNGHCSTEIFPIRPAPNADRRYLYYWLSMDSTVKEIALTSTGARMPRANVDAILEFPIPLPSLPEQQRIVAILDEVFAGLATATAHAERNLKNARELFESYVDSVFQQNVEWERTTLGAIAEFKNGLNFTKSSKGETIRIVGVKDFQNHFWVPMDDLESAQIDGGLSEAYLLRKNDILTVRSNGNKQLIGRCILAGEVAGKVSHSGFTIRIRAVRPDIEPVYLVRYLKSGGVRRALIESGDGAQISNLNQQALTALPVMLPSRQKQQEIMMNLAELEAEAEQLQERYEQRIADLAELKQSILQKAFSGELTSPPSQAIKEAAE
jgi:type I restriction enzyme, S subunit